MALVIPTIAEQAALLGYQRELYKYLRIFGENQTTPLSDPGADRILFWDDSASKMTWLTVSTGLTLSGTALSLSAGEVTSGTYSPTLTNVTNIDTSTVIGTHVYSRVGSGVSVGGQVQINATTAGIQTELGISLPIASSGVNKLYGAAGAHEAAARGGGFEPDGANSRASLKLFPTTDTATNYSYMFIYWIE
jgi:hypothetical protein